MIQSSAKSKEKARLGDAHSQRISCHRLHQNRPPPLPPPPPPPPHNLTCDNHHREYSRIQKDLRKIYYKSFCHRWKPAALYYTIPYPSSIALALALALTNIDHAPLHLSSRPAPRNHRLAQPRATATHRAPRPPEPNRDNIPPRQRPSSLERV